jgi:hypothetical protein
MKRQRLLIGLIAVVMVAFGFVASVKLSSTPKFDRIALLMPVPEAACVIDPTQTTTWRESSALLPTEFTTGDRLRSSLEHDFEMECDEGLIRITISHNYAHPEVVAKQLIRRSPLDRIRWHLGWRPKPPPPVTRLPILITPPPPPKLGEGVSERP